MLPTGAKTLRMLSGGFDTHRADVSVWIAGFRVQADKSAYDPRVKAAGAGAPPGRTRRQERLYSAVARIYYLTAPLLQYQRSAARQAALTHVLKFVRTTQTFLTSPESRDNFSLQRLRRYFCGTVERHFDSLASLNDSARFIPRNMHLALYRMCEEWCQLGYQSEMVRHRLILMQRASAASSSDHGAETDSTVEHFHHETVLLSSAAIGALSSLCVSPVLSFEHWNVG